MVHQMRKENMNHLHDDHRQPGRTTEYEEMTQQIEAATEVGEE